MDRDREADVRVKWVKGAKWFSFGSLAGHDARNSPSLLSQASALREAMSMTNR
jgi:hypothetical protein